MDAGHQVGEVDSVAQDPKEDVVRNVGHHGHARKGRYVTAPEKMFHNKLNLGVFFNIQQEDHLVCLNAISNQ